MTARKFFIGRAIVLLAVAIAAGAYFTLFGQRTLAPSPEPTPGENFGKPTDFARIGTITFDAPGLAPEVPYLVFEAPGAPALTKALRLDAESFCATNTGALPCVAMSVSLSIPFGGKRALVEGIEQADGSILVRKLGILREDGAEYAPQPGNIFVSWPQAVALVENCRVKHLMQTHSLDIFLTLADGRRVQTMEPVIDEVFVVEKRAQAACGAITSGTE